MKTTVKLSVLVGLVLLALCLSLAACERTPAQSGEQSSEQTPAQSGEQSSDQGEATGEIAFALNEAGDGYVVTGIGTFTGTELVIPSTYEGLPVVEIAQEAFKDCTQLTSVIFPATIEQYIQVGDYAFAGCTGLTQITFPATAESYVKIRLLSLHDYAFAGCTGLTQVTITATCNLYDHVFEGCTGLESATIHSSYGDTYLFTNCTKLKHVEFGQDVLVDLYGLGHIEWSVDDPDVVPEGAKGVSSKQQYDENGEALYDENGEPIVEYYAWAYLPLESVKGGIIGSYSYLSRYPNLNSGNMTDYTLAEGCQMIDGVMFATEYDYDTEQENVVAFWIDPLVESLDFVKLSGIGEIDRYLLPNCVNLTSITIDSTASNFLSNIPKLSLTDINFAGSIFDWADKIGTYYGDSCAIHCTDGDISKELGAALSCTYSITYYQMLYDMYAPFLEDVEILEEYRVNYDAVLAKKTAEEYESYAEYANAAKGSEEYELYQEYLAYRTVNSRFNTTRYRRLNDLLAMYRYYKGIEESSIDVEAAIRDFKNVHLPLLESTFSCTVEYEPGKEGDLTAVTNANRGQLPDTLRNLVRIFAKLSDPNCPKTPAEAKALYEQAVAAMIEPGYITQEELNERLPSVE